MSISSVVSLCCHVPLRPCGMTAGLECSSCGRVYNPTADTLRASLAAAEEKLADADEQLRLDALNESTLRQMLADERKHADALDAALRDPDSITVERARAAHAARRAHDDQCESEFDSQAHAQTPCGCAARRQEEAR